ALFPAPPTTKSHPPPFFALQNLALLSTLPASPGERARCFRSPLGFEKENRMELLSRPKNDRYTRPGQYCELERRLRNNPDNANIPVLVCYAFDWRTRLGPFLFATPRLLTAGPRAIAAALYQAGFTKTRIVLRQWNRYLRPSEARIDGLPPQMLFVSSMQIHSASAYELI